MPVSGEKDFRFGAQTMRAGLNPPYWEAGIPYTLFAYCYAC
jgi:hypothetical protein